MMNLYLRIMIPILLLSTILLAIDLYSMKGIKELANEFNVLKFERIFKIASWTFTSLVILSLILIFIFFDKIDLAKSYSMFFFVASLVIVVYLSKLSFITFHLIEDLIYVSSKYIFSNGIRLFFISKIGIISGFLTLVLALYGIFFGKYQYTIHPITIQSNKIPKEFNDFKIVQISDLHIGSFRNNPSKLEKAIDLINAQKPDLILFTGDLVNNFASEVQEFKSILKKLSAKHGTYSVLGNHDYGEYYKWKSVDKKKKNLENLYKIEEEIGFNLLLNSSIIIEKDSAKIAILGVENWGLPPFPAHGDLNMALENIENIDAKILMSHDPTHWTEQVKEKTDILLTLSGHTHGMQMGFEFGRFRWSPVKFKYPLWAGLYEENNQYLYVNRGLGFIGFSGRVGIWPEITVITLKN
ncbi:MAG TPA: metallophosphoesterase [Bacteroidales bacterium]|nr:metallophosphoesterase [Bacteroidales bacterium]